MKNNFYKFIIIGFILFVVYQIYSGYSIKNEINKNGVFSIGKYVSQDRKPKVEQNFMIYYFKDRKIKANGGRAPKGFTSNIGKFYKIRYSESNPNYAEAFFDEEITDTTLILKAGFSREDIENMPK